MAKARVKSSSSPLYIAIILAIVAFIGFKSILSDGSSSQSSGGYSTKQASERTYEDWKQIADGHTRELEECSAKLINDDGWRSVGDACVAQHRNNWVSFRDGLDDLSNLTFEQREKLKEYWDSQFDLAMTRIRAKIDERERSERPNRY